jgi:hypothetical protein
VASIVLRGVRSHIHTVEADGVILLVSAVLVVHKRRLLRV